MSNKKKLLIIEDDDFIRDMYEREFKNEGYEVDSISNAEDAEKMIKKIKYDLALVDIMLPGKSGLDMVQDLKNDKNFKNTAFIMLTNLGQETIVKQGLSLGAKGYLIKSAYTPKQIVHEINNYFDNL